MLPDLPESTLDQIRSHALRHITERGQTNTNLSLDSRVYRAGEHIGPKKQGIRAEQPTVVVFADDEPRANFGHPCRYLLYHAESGEFLREVPARFPPSLLKSASRLTGFFKQVEFNLPPPYWYRPPIYICPRIIPSGNRYAILYAGLTQGRHLNDMEFAYRTLIHVYGFKPQNIYVLNYDGTLNVFDITLGNWPGNNTPFTLQVTGQGTRAAFQAAFSDLAGKLQPEDLLFIHTNNHGDNFNDGNGSFMCGFLHGGDPAPNDDGDFQYYYATEFAADLATLPPHRALIAMLEQCCSGGFNGPILGASTAQSVSVAAAATSQTLSYVTSDGLWDGFAYEWIAAVHGAYPNGSALHGSADANHDGVIDAQEAYNYALINDGVGDTPQFDAWGSGATLTLDQQYRFAWVWCWILWPIFHPIWRETFPEFTWPPQPNPPDPAPYYSLLNRVLPEIQQLLLPALEQGLEGLRTDLGATLAPILRRAVEDEKRAS